MELRQLSERVFVLEGSTNIGIIRGNQGQALIIDTGLDESTARKIWRHCQEMKVTPAVIFTTHAHADHFGGNAFLVKRGGARVLASPEEGHTLAMPLLEPLGLYGGVMPPANLRNKFLLAQPSPVDGLLQPGRQDIGGVEGEVVPLPGHAPGQMGLAIDGIVFTADAFFPQEVLDKHRIPFLVDLRQTVATLEGLKEAGWQIYIPGHGKIVDRDQIRAELDYNLERLAQIKDLIRKSLGGPRTAEDVLVELLEHYQLAAEAPSLYHLDLAAVKAFLTSLTDAGEVEMRVRQNRLYWQRKDL